LHLNSSYIEGDFPTLTIECLLVPQNRDGTAMAEMIYKKLERRAVRAELIDENCREE